METPAVQLIPGRWPEVFEAWADSVERSALLASPFISRAPIEAAIERWHKRGTTNVLEVQVITDLSPSNVLHGSLEPSALLYLVRSVPHTSVLHLPNLHAKVYIADDSRAIITSANLTSSGLERNSEYGVLLGAASLVQRVRRDLDGVRAFGSEVTPPRLERWAAAAEDLRPLRQMVEHRANRQILREFRRRIEEVALEVRRIRAHGQSDNSIYSRVILSLLKQHGPLTTRQLHPMIQRLLLDMCDDGIDRVIDGVHFGRRWKHMARNAQQYLKRQGLIVFDGRRWFVPWSREGEAEPRNSVSS